MADTTVPKKAPLRPAVATPGATPSGTNGTAKATLTVANGVQKPAPPKPAVPSPAPQKLPDGIVPPLKEMPPAIFPALADDESDPCVSFLIYGEPGRGKTSLAETSPGPRLWINLEPSGLNVINWADRDNRELPKPWGKLVTSWEDAVHVLEWLEWTAKSGALQSEIKTVILDTATELGNLLDAFILRHQGPTGRVHPRSMSQADYGWHATEILEYIRRLIRLPVHVVVTAHTTNGLVVHNKKALTVTLPALGGKKAPKDVPGIFTAVGYLTKSTTQIDAYGEPLRVLELTDYNDRITKIRVRRNVPLPKFLPDANLSQLFEIIVKSVRGEEVDLPEVDVSPYVLEELDVGGSSVEVAAEAFVASEEDVTGTEGDVI